MVLTVFWADNFDIIVENAASGGSAHTTHLVAFQEQSENTSLEIYSRFSTENKKLENQSQRSTNSNPICWCQERASTI